MEKLLKAVEKYSAQIKEAEEFLWQNAEAGYKEYVTNAYMIEQFEKLGYSLNKAQDITGFSTTIDTKKEGPTIAILAELDGLYSNGHPATNEKTGCCHACGHHIQLSAMLGIAYALKEEGVLDELCGKIKLIVVPAEEGIEISYRLNLIKEGKITFSSGKPEFIKRGFFNDVDICYMVHASNLSIYKDKAVYRVGGGHNGVIRKKTTIIGKASHAGGAPENGINALNAASMVISAINNLRETFKDEDHIRVHSIITEGGSSVNVVPNKVVIESYVRGADSRKLKDANDKVNRAIVSSVAIFGASVTITDMAGSEPLITDEKLKTLAGKVMEDLVGKDGYVLDNLFEGSSTDMGDVSNLFPSIHAYVGGVEGRLHDKEFRVTDKDIAVVGSAKFQVGLLYSLLKDNAKEAYEIIKNFKPTFNSIEEYVEYKTGISEIYEGVEYLDNGDIKLHFKK